MGSYPTTAAERDRFVLERRGPRRERDPWRFQELLVEDERTATGTVARTATVFLTGRECPWRCVMCDLWQNTIEADTPPGAIAAQVAAACDALRRSADEIALIKLYNAGSFFDPRAVPEVDYDGVAASLTGFAQIVVESHPALVGRRVDRFLDALERHTTCDRRAAALEVAMGLETAHTEALERLHKRMTVDDFARAAEALRLRNVALRVFLLVSPPFVPSDEQDEWLCRSIDVAIASGASVVSLVPTRKGNGAIDALSAEGLFRSPRLADLEHSIELALSHVRGRGRIFVDVWDVQRFSDCPHCLDERRARLREINLVQRMLPPARCRQCGAGTP